MNIYRESADASSIYCERSAADVAQMNSTAPYGNLAALMKDAVLLSSRIIINGKTIEWWVQE